VRAHRDAPLGDAARGIALQDPLESGDRIGELEGVEERHRMIELLADRGRAGRLEMDRPEMLGAGPRRLCMDEGR